MRWNGPLLSFAPAFRQFFAAALYVIALCVLAAVFIRPAVSLPVIGLGLGLICLVGWRFYRRIGRLAWHTRRFRTISADRIRIHYDPELESKLNRSVTLENCRGLLDELAKQFESPPRRAVSIFVLTSASQLIEMLGPRFWAAALPQCWSIAIGHDNAPMPIVRHELAHLFAYRWSFYAPPLLAEGLPTWLQWSNPNGEIDDLARPFAADPKLRLSKLLRPRFFFANANLQPCYMLAGSFSGYLIKRYGWKNYRRLYRSCDGFLFRWKFRICFGVRFEEAEQQWRKELLAASSIAKSPEQNA